MMNNKKIYYGDEILDTIDECYFAPGRDKEYPTLEIKYAAQCALLRLWNMYLLELGDEVYYNQDIRRIVFEDAPRTLGQRSAALHQTRQDKRP